MAPAPKFTDQQLKQYMAMDFTPEEIARYFHVTRQAVEQRMAKLEKPAALAHPAVVQSACASVWNVKQALEENYARCLKLLQPEDPLEGADPIKVCAEVRQHLKLAMDVLQAMYSVNEVQTFQEEVLTILEECEPGSRQRILERLRQRRSVRAAFTSS